MYKRILVPVVFDDGHDTQASFEIARVLGAEDAQFTVLHVMEITPGYVSAQIPEEVLDNCRQELDGLLQKAAQALPAATPMMANGKPGRVIVDTASDLGIDCIVMASHQPGLENLIIGSTADWVVRHAHCSVHVMR
ncbi:MAG: universal stress protein [Pseudomonadota bacterium]